MPDLLFRLGTGGQRSSRSSQRRSGRQSSGLARSSATGTINPIDYCVALAEGADRAAANLDIATIQGSELAMMFRLPHPAYLMRRAADWRERGYTETLADFAALNARSNSGATMGRAGFKNWERSPTRATRWVGATVSTSASCCASSCRAST